MPVNLLFDISTNSNFGRNNPNSGIDPVNLLLLTMNCFMTGNINPADRSEGILEVKLLFPRFSTVTILLPIIGIGPVKRLFDNSSICNFLLLLKLGIVEDKLLFEKDRNVRFVKVVREHSFPENEVLVESNITNEVSSCIDVGIEPRK